MQAAKVGFARSSFGFVIFLWFVVAAIQRLNVSATWDESNRSSRIPFTPSLPGCIVSIGSKKYTFGANE